MRVTRLEVEVFCVALLFFLLVGSNKPAVAAGVRRAVVIGIDTYGQLAELPTLKAAASDARKVADVLATHGYARERIQLLTTMEDTATTRPTRLAIVKAITSAAESKEVDREDTLTIVFAGHGFSIGGESYVCPEDFDRKKPAVTGLGIAEIAALVNRSPARTRYVVVDACRKSLSGSHQDTFDLLTTLKRHASSRPSNGDSDQVGATFFFSSCMPGELSYEQPSAPIQGGVFLHFLAKALAGHADYDGGNHDGQVSGFEAMTYAATNTQDYVRALYDGRQTPWSDCESVLSPPLIELDGETRSAMNQQYGTLIIDGLKSLQRRQAESLIDSGLGPLARGERAMTIRFATAAIGSDDRYALARRVRSLMYQLEGNNRPAEAAQFYSGAIRDMRAVNGYLRVRLIQSQSLRAQGADDIDLRRGDAVFIDELKDANGAAWLHVAGVRRANDDPLAAMTTVHGYLELRRIADPESNDEQIEDFRRSLAPTDKNWAIQIAGRLALAALANARPSPSPNSRATNARAVDSTSTQSPDPKQATDRIEDLVAQDKSATRLTNINDPRELFNSTIVSDHGIFTLDDKGGLSHGATKLKGSWSFIPQTRTLQIVHENSSRAGELKATHSMVLGDSGRFEGTTRINIIPSPEVKAAFRQSGNYIGENGSNREFRTKGYAVKNLDVDAFIRRVTPATPRIKHDGHGSTGYHMEGPFSK